MSEVEPLKTQAKNPVDSAVTKLREAAQKEFQKKLDEQLKTTLDAAKSFRNEKAKLESMLSDFEADKVAFKDLIDGIV